MEWLKAGKIVRTMEAEEQVSLDRLMVEIKMKELQRILPVTVPEHGEVWLRKRLPSWRILVSLERRALILILVNA